MAETIVFRLEAPLAAFGGLAVGERRSGHRRPAHSAILGLVAGAIGLRREDPGHETLVASFWLATRCDRLGAPLADFHTAQTPPQKKGQHFATRADELVDKHDLGTIVSRRDYWTDATFTVLLWPTPECVHDPKDIAAALNRPRFAGFLGRKSCPLGHPPNARIVSADRLDQAFRAYDVMLAEHVADDPLLSRAGGDEIAFDLALRPMLGEWIERSRENRRDHLLSRANWQFGLRAEGLAGAKQ